MSSIAFASIYIYRQTAEYVVEGHRFDIFEDIGCYPATYITPLAFLFLLCWPLAIGVVSAIYCCKCTLPLNLSLKMNQYWPSRSYYPLLYKTLFENPYFSLVLILTNPRQPLLPPLRLVCHCARLHHFPFFLYHCSQC